jgi:hypothetical protein
MTFYTYLPMAYKIQIPGNYSEENIKHEESYLRQNEVELWLG